MESADLKPGSMESADLKPGSMESADLKPGSMESADLKPGSMESADLKPGSMESADLKPSLADLRASMEAFYANKIREAEITKMLSSEPARNESGTERPSSSDIAIPPIPTGSIDPRGSPLPAEQEIAVVQRKEKTKEETALQDQGPSLSLNEAAVSNHENGIPYPDFARFRQLSAEGRQFVLGDQPCYVSSSDQEVASDYSLGKTIPQQDDSLSDTGSSKDSELSPSSANGLHAKHLKHPNWKIYRCDICEKTFTKSSHLADHQRIHTGIKPYSCDLCGKGFTQKSQLTQHKRKHTGERPYICGVCGKCFAENNGLINHMRTHSGEKPFKCDVCGKGFAEAGNLVKHKRIHSGEKPYKCHVCGKGFSENGSLTKHIRVHSGEKPYKCQVCDRRFTQSGDLKSHERMHSGERPYKCYICGKGFIANSALNKHLRLHARLQNAEMQYKLDMAASSLPTSSSVNFLLPQQ